MFFKKSASPKGGPLNLVFLSNQPHCGPWRRQTHDIQTWATALEADGYNYLRFSVMRAIRDYRIIIIELTSQVFGLVKKIKERYPDKILIGALEGSLHSLDNDHTLKNKKGFLEVYRNVDALGVLIEDSIPYFKSITPKPVFYLGVPFPVEWSRDHIIAPGKKELIIETYTNFSTGKGGTTNCLTMKEIQKIHPEAKARIYSYKKSYDSYLAKLLGINVEILPHTDWQKYFIRHCQAYIALHLDYRWSWNRYSLDCAAAGIPCISTPHSTVHKILFPDLCVEPFDIPAAVKLADQLIEDQGFYRRCRELALEKTALFNYKNSADRIKDFLRKQNWL